MSSSTMSACGARKNSMIIKCKDVKLKFLSTKGNDFGSNCFFTVKNKTKLKDLISKFEECEQKKEVAISQGETPDKMHFPMFMSDQEEFIIKINREKLQSGELEKGKLYNATMEFKYYDFVNKEKETIKGWSCSAEVSEE